MILKINLWRLSDVVLQNLWPLRKWKWAKGLSAHHTSRWGLWENKRQVYFETDGKWLIKYENSYVSYQNTLSRTKRQLDKHKHHLCLITYGIKKSLKKHCTGTAELLAGWCFSVPACQTKRQFPDNLSHCGNAIAWQWWMENENITFTQNLYFCLFV